MFLPTHRYIGIGAVGGIAPGAKVTLVDRRSDEPLKGKASVMTADGAVWFVPADQLVPLEEGSDA